MIHLPWWSQFKSKWWAACEAQVRQAHAGQLATLTQACQQELEALTQAHEQRLKAFHLQRQDLATSEGVLKTQQEQVRRAQLDVEDLHRRMEDRRQELTKANEELRAQVRLLEAKAAPDSVWVEAFSRGYEKAWESMWPLMSDGVNKSRDALRQQAIDETLENLAPVLSRQALPVHPNDAVSKFQVKLEEFRAKQIAATDPGEQAKYAHYIDALGWVQTVLGSSDGHSISTS